MVSYTNKLRCLVCPFKVKVIKPIGILKQKQIVYVSEVKITLELVTIYVIKGFAYYYYHFDIIIDE
ncbi:hypothetical protein FF125_17385 [Aureibaculum algae]|uniref:Uncharacterized protein n=1 Tax=Aureibaculum algae TaxID=2584122 RepID=A0A5B7TXS9_9FLAO|nr:hypothetical protein FF125_17385 [Aureibaculum algae]